MNGGGRILNVILRVRLNARKATIIPAIPLVFCLPNDRAIERTKRTLV